MLYKRTNKAGNTMELLSVGDVSFMRAKLDDRLYKTMLILKSGEIVHINLTQVELDELTSKIEWMIQGTLLLTSSRKTEVSPPLEPSIDELIDELATKDQISTDSIEESK